MHTDPEQNTSSRLTPSPITYELNCMCNAFVFAATVITAFTNKNSYSTSSSGNMSLVSLVGNPLPISEAWMSAPYSTDTSSSIQFTSRQNSFSTVSHGTIYSKNNFLHIFFTSIQTIQSPLCLIVLYITKYGSLFRIAPSTVKKYQSNS